MKPTKAYSKAYEQFRQQLKELGGSEIPAHEVTFWDSRLSNEKRGEILRAAGFEFVQPSTPWAKLSHEKREVIKLKVRNLVRGYSSFVGLEVVNG